MKISNNDIRRRIFNLNESYSSGKVAYNEYLLEEAVKGENISAITKSLKMYRDIISSDVKNEAKIYEQMLDLFDLIYEKCGYPSQEIDTVIHYLNEVTDRVRTPKEMVTLLKRRIALGTKSRGVTKFNTRLENNKKNDVGKSVSKELESKTNELGAKVQVPKLTIPSIGSNGGSSSSSSKDNVSESCYKELISRCELNAEVDRILGNYNKLSKRFNVDRVLDYIGSNIPDDIDLFCDLFNTWSDKEMSKKSKFNVAIETALYINNKRNNPVNRTDLIESIVDYHLFAGESFDTIYSYLESNSMITDEDLSYYRNDNTFTGIRSIIEAEVENPDKNLAVNLKNYKKSDKKDHISFKQLIAKAYTKNPDQIINNAPKFFDIFRFFVIMGTIAINPILGLVTFFTDQFLRREFSREETDKMITKYEKEIDKLQKKINKCENEEKKKRLKEYKRTMEDNLYKLQDYEKELYTDEEQEAKEAERDAKRDYGDSDEYDWNFDEAASFMAMTEYLMEVDKSKIEKCIESNMSIIIETDVIDDITDFAIQSGGFISIDTLKSIYENYYYQLRKADKKNYIAMDTIKSNINKLCKGYNEEADSIKVMEGCYLFVEAIKMMENDSPYFLEVSFKNTFTVVKNKIQDAVKTMSDKEKQFSSSIDIACAGFQNDVESFFKSDAREAVLKGRILPKASKIIKGALAFGITSWLVHPMIAVIGVLGYIGVSSVCRNKERQIILDEIDTELEMVDKYIQAAESKDNLKAVKKLLTTKKRLQKERTRIKYKMKMHGEKIDPDVDFK